MKKIFFLLGITLSLTINAQTLTIYNGKHLYKLSENIDDFVIHSVPNDSNLFRIDSDNMNVYIQEEYTSGLGKVIIGSKTLADCLTCSDYKLFVKDGIRTEKVKVDIATGVWADYVFKKDYQLRPLAEVEKFIAKNGHLPEVPSEKEAIANGIELKEMNILLLKKVEELTLYTLQQQKQIDEQQKRETEQNRRIELLENKINNAK